MICKKPPLVIPVPKTGECRLTRNPGLPLSFRPKAKARRMPGRNL